MKEGQEKAEKNVAFGAEESQEVRDVFLSGSLLLNRSLPRFRASGPTIEVLVVEVGELQEMKIALSLWQLLETRAYLAGRAMKRMQWDLL